MGSQESRLALSQKVGEVAIWPVAPPGVDLKEQRTGVPTNIYTEMFTAAQFTVGKKKKKKKVETTQIPTNKQIRTDKMWSGHTADYCSAIKNKGPSWAECYSLGP